MKLDVESFIFNNYVVLDCLTIIHFCEGKKETNMYLTTSKSKNICYDMGRNFSKIWKITTLYNKVNKGHKLLIQYLINILKYNLTLINGITCYFT